MEYETRNRCRHGYRLTEVELGDGWRHKIANDCRLCDGKPETVPFKKHEPPKPAKDSEPVYFVSVKEEPKKKRRRKK